MPAPTPQAILFVAEELHKFYRAAFLSQHGGNGTMMGVGRRKNKTGSGCRNEHDHGWTACHRKAYFMRRAVLLLRAPRREYKLKQQVPF